MYVTALRWTDTEFLIKTRNIKPVKHVIDSLEAWDVDWSFLVDSR
jgi:hypothetical protein